MSRTNIGEQQPAAYKTLISLAAQLEAERPWAERLPPTAKP